MFVRDVWACAPEQKRARPLLPAGWDRAASPSSRHRVQLVRVELPVRVGREMSSRGFLLASVCSDWWSSFHRYLTSAWPVGTACHGLMTSVETASVAPLPTCLRRASSKRTECPTPSTMCTGGFACGRVSISAVGLVLEVRTKILKRRFRSMTIKVRLFRSFSKM